LPPVFGDDVSKLACRQAFQSFLPVSRRANHDHFGSALRINGGDAERLADLAKFEQDLAEVNIFRLHG
jgi:hypothetical protein